MEAKTKSEKFVERKKQNWEDLRVMVLKISRSGVKSLTSVEVLHFPRLYRLICTDLAEAKSLKLSHDVIIYLNQIVGQAHKYIYSIPPIKKSNIKKFFLFDLPGVIYKNWPFVLTASLIFFLPMIISYLIVVNEPKLASRVVPESVLYQMEHSYSKPLDEERSASSGTFATSFYISNNVSIAFACFASGVLLGIGSIYFLIYNGIVLGAIEGFIVGIGYGDNFYTFVTAHSVFELSGIALAGAAGLLMGYNLVHVKKYTRKDWLKLKRNNLFTLITAGALLIFFAAFIEGFISPNPYPYELKMGIAIFSLIFIIIYFFVLPIINKRMKQ